MTTDVTFDLRHLDFLVFFLREVLFFCGKIDIIKRSTVDTQELSKPCIFFIKYFIKVLMLCFYCVSIAMKAFHFFLRILMNLAAERVANVADIIMPKEY